jgi:hypothetical protein
MKLSEIQTLIATDPDTLFHTKDGFVRIASITDQRLGYSLGMVSAPFVIKVSTVQYIRAKDGKPSHCRCFNTRALSSRSINGALTNEDGVPMSVKDLVDHMDKVSLMVDELLQKENQ